MNFIDKAVSIINPLAGLRRLQAKESIRRYEAAQKSRRTDGLHNSSSINQDTLREGKSLRDGARYLEQNNPYAKKAFRTFKLNAVGTGIRPAVKGTGTKAKTIKKAFDQWANGLGCDFDHHLTFYGLQGLVMYNIAMSGEILILRRRIATQDVPLQLQAVEPEYLDHTKDKDKTAGGGYISQGIEYDRNGRRLGYWLYERHPMEFMQPESRFISADDVIHLFLKERPGQQRGVPFIHASMLRMNDFDQYEDAELIRKKIATCFTAFVTETDTGITADAAAEMQLDYGRMEPGRIQKLNPGESVTLAGPPTAEGFGEYSRTTLSGVSAGIGVSYETLTNDYSNVNFSSGRMGWIEFQRLIEDLQENLLIPVFCARVWEWFCEALALRKGGSYNEIAIAWTSPRREMIDPVKETKAILEQVKAGLITWQEAVRQQGYDPDEIAEAYKADIQLFDKLGLKLSVDFRNELLRYAKGSENTEPTK